VARPFLRKEENMADIKPVIGKPEAAWGGIGGSGKHAQDLLAEISQPEFAKVLERLPQKAWGGIGGSGKHPLEGLEPEIRPK
jgi:hypothetical protein